MSTKQARPRLSPSEIERRKYNRDVAAIDRLKEEWRAKSGAAGASAERRLKAAWVAFDEKWNGYTPTEDQMERWLQAIAK